MLEDAQRIGGRRDHRRDAGHARSRVRLWHHAQRRFGPRGRFSRKAEDRREVALVRTEPAWIDRPRRRQPRARLPGEHGHLSVQSRPLVDVLTKTDYHDFGKEDLSRVDPPRAKCRCTCSTAIGKTSARSQSFYQATSTWRRRNPPFDLSSAECADLHPRRFLPPSRIDGATIRQSLISDGCDIGEGAVIENSVDRPTLPDRPRRDDSQFGRDGGRRLRFARHDGPLPARRFRRALAKDRRSTERSSTRICRIGARVRIVNDQVLDGSEETPEYMICDGIVVVQKGAVLPDGWKL